MSVAPRARGEDVPAIPAPYIFIDECVEVWMCVCGASDFFEGWYQWNCAKLGGEDVSKKMELSIVTNL